MWDSALIVDDDEADRYLLRRLLTRAQLASVIYEVGNPYQALLEMESGRYPGHEERAIRQLVLVDVNMPRVNGFEFAERLSAFCQRDGRHNISVLMCSSSAREEDRQRASQISLVRGYIVKRAMSAEELRKEICDILHVPNPRR